MFTNLQYVITDGRTDGQPENRIPLAANRIAKA